MPTEAAVAMTEHDDTPPPNIRGGRMALDRPSYETGESSTAFEGTETSRRSPPVRPYASPREGERGGNGTKGRKGHKYRSSGGFLLQDAVAGEGGDGENLHRRKHSRLLNLRTKGSPKTSEKSTPNAGKEVGLGIVADESSSPTVASPESPATGKNLNIKKSRDAKDAKIDDKGAAAPEDPPLDVESAQIVDMALRISESRRRASQRPVSQPLPPRLAPLPDSTQGSSLRQHLLQQRKVSRNGSPRGEKGMFLRSASGIRPSSGLGGAFDSAPDGGFRYHFSQSTLARAQKAREHIELMAQYRRLLELVPPLRSTNAGSPPTSPNVGSKIPAFGSFEANQKLGRHYNPLQYIRNRKVRARERQAIDGENQGFGDVVRVTDWVDHVAKWTATGQHSVVDGQTLPLFAGTENAPQDASATSSTPQASAKAKRRRVDWVVQPADLIADAYWLEQGHNKQLIEDRHWNRVYHQAVESALRPLSRQNEEPTLNTTPWSTTKDLPETSEAPSDVKLAKVDTDHSHNSARERARQKLQDLKGFHHRHNSSVHSHHEFLRLRRGSGSELSDSDGEMKDRRLRSGTLTTTSKDILEKQMMEMIAREEREKVLAGPRVEPTRPKPLASRTPEQDKESVSKPPSRFHSRQGSFADASEPEEKGAGKAPARAQSPYRRHRGRPTLDVPIPPLHPSLEIDTSVPNSPECRTARSSHEFSPASSRPGTPTRNPFTKVKQIFRERSRERRGSMGERLEDGDQSGDAKNLNGELLSPTEGKTSSPERHRSRQRSHSASRKVHSRGNGESSRGHRAVASLGFRGEERPTGIRGIFKGPGARIDNVIRGSVSKIGDIIWRRESVPAAEAAVSEGAVTDESETEQRGRRRNSMMASRRGSRRNQEDASASRSKSYLDQMPKFQAAEHARSNGAMDGDLARPKPSREPSSQSSRISNLRPPRLDVQRASPPDGRIPRLRDSDVSDSDSHKGSKSMQGVLAADKRLSSMLNMPPSFVSTRRTVSQQPSRHWSISDRDRSPEHGPISKREIARLRALILSSGIKAMEISRRSNEPQRLFATDKLPASKKVRPADTKGLHWPEIACLSPDAAALHNRSITRVDIYPLAAHTLGAAIQSSGQKWQSQANTFVSETAPSLQRDVDELRTLLAIDLSSKARAAADEADETCRDLAMGQRLKVKRVVDVIEKMGRRRRRRFRWVRRGMWLGVEWVLVGFMWYVWFVVMVFRLVFGVGKGVVGGVRWLLWL